MFPQEPLTKDKAALLALLNRFSRGRLQSAWRSCANTSEPALADLSLQQLHAALPRLSATLGAGQLDWRAPQNQWLRALGTQRRHPVRLLVLGELPLPLRRIPDPPLALFVQGPEQLLTAPAVALVGARRASAVGARIALALASALAARGLVIVSGLALGIDGQVHRGALATGKTVAVLGGGLLRPSPARHQGLAAKLLEQGGCLVSEYSLTSPSYASNFPERNRLISGLVSAVVVVEAGLRSGSLITARLALEQGREVLAVPGSVLSPVSAGCHRLLQQGAGLVTSAEDVLRALGEDTLAGTPPSIPQPAPQATLYTALVRHAGVPVDVESLQRQTGMSSRAVLQALTELELAGFVQRLPEGYIPSPP